MSPVNGDSFGRLKVTIARLCGDHKESGAATGGGTTSVIDTKKFTDANDNSPRLTGKWLYIWNGASQGTEVRTTAFTASTDTITIPTSTAIDSTSEYLITERFSNTDITTAIRTVISRYGRYALGYIDRSLIAGSPLANGTFYLYPTSLDSLRAGVRAAQVEPSLKTRLSPGAASTRSRLFRMARTPAQAIRI